MTVNIAISSGKGGTGKTFVSTNIARTLERRDIPEKTGIAEHSSLPEQSEKNKENSVRYLDCDVEEPNGHLFLHPLIEKEEDVSLYSPVGIDQDRCTTCGKCAEACHYNAIAILNDKALFFQNLCHICGACTIVCPENAIIEKQRKIGRIKHGHSSHIDFHYATLETAEGGMSPRLIKKVKHHLGNGINILDSSPGTACPVVETVKDADLCVLVTDPTPFGIHDLKLAVDMCREIDQEPVILVNRARYMNDDLKSYCRREHLDIIGEIPDDRKIAECYSKGNLVVDDLPQYRDLFSDIAYEMVRRAKKKTPIKKKPKAILPDEKDFPSENTRMVPQSEGGRTKEVVVISGKGGTGKTSLVASFCALDTGMAIADCDVDAADLHLILQPEVKEQGFFSGSDTADIDPNACIGCGICYESCRFEAIHEATFNGKDVYEIDKMACEGCGVCCLVCPEEAVLCRPAINGEWFTSETRFGPMSHATLGAAEENSGKLVTLVKNNKDKLANKFNLKEALIDGSPGTGCPVISSITGADYAVVVTEPTVSGIHDLRRVLDVINFFEVPSGIVVNKYDLNEQKTEEIMNIAKENGSDSLGKIPYNPKITEAQVQGLSLIEYSNDQMSEKIKNLWKTIRDRLAESS